MNKTGTSNFWTTPTTLTLKNMQGNGCPRRIRCNWILFLLQRKSNKQQLNLLLARSQFEAIHHIESNQATLISLRPLKSLPIFKIMAIYLSNLTSKRVSNEIVCQCILWLGASTLHCSCRRRSKNWAVLQFLLRFQVWEGLHWALDQEEVFTHQKKLNAWGGALAAAG